MTPQVVSDKEADEMGVPKIIKQNEYLLEVECNEPDTRHWRHRWCYTHNKGKCLVRPVLPCEVDKKGKQRTSRSSWTSRSSRRSGGPSVTAYCNEDEPLVVSSLLANAVEKRPAKFCMGVRTITRIDKRDGEIWNQTGYMFNTYSELEMDVRALAKGLLGLDQVVALKSAGKCFAGILADTSAEWMTSAQACFRVGIPVTTVYTTLGHEAMAHGLNETESPLLFLDWYQFRVLDKAVLSKCPALKHVVLIGKCWVPDEVIGGVKVGFPSVQEAESLKKHCMAKVTTLDGLIVAGMDSSMDLRELGPKEDDLAVLMYTSGSTGLPKGVMLSNVNLVSVIGGAWAQGICCTANPTDRYIAYLPLAHIFELVGELGVLASCAQIGYGHPKTLTASSAYTDPGSTESTDLRKLGPHMMLAVPMMLDAIKNAVELKIDELGGFFGKCWQTAIDQQLGESTHDRGLAHKICKMGLRRKVIEKMRYGVGLENLRWIGCYGAPLAPQTQHYITCVFAPVVQGFGSTETSGISAVQEVFSRDGRAADSSIGSVGPTIPSGELKLRSVPDMGYRVTDMPPRGEILLGGTAVTQMGYYKKPEKTEEDLPYHADGRRWFHTGDIGEVTETGVLRVIDRMKDLIKLSNGEYVALGKVENALKQVKGIAACVVFARPDKDHIVAIVSQPEKGWKFVGGKPGEEELMQRIGDSLRAQKLARFEIPTGVKVDDMIWNPDTGLMTASMKLQRNPLREHYNSFGGLLDQMDYRFT